MRIHEKCFDCVTEKVGIRGCDDELECELFIDDLGGISAEFLESIADPSKHDGYMSVFANAKKNALPLFELDVINAFGKFSTYKKEVLTTGEAGLYRPITQFNSTKSKYGVFIELPKNRHQIAKIDSVSFYPRNSGSVTITIAEVITNTVLHTETISVEPKLYEYEIKKDFIVEFNGEVLIVYIESNDVSFNRLHCDSCSSAIGSGSGCRCSLISDSVAFSSVHFDSFSDFLDKGSSVSETPMCIKASVQCDISQIICDYADEFARSYMLKVYLQLIEFQMLSPQINYLAEVNFVLIKDEIKPLKQKEYYATLNRTVKNIYQNLVGKSLCFSCQPENGEGFFIFSRA